MFTYKKEVNPWKKETWKKPNVLIIPIWKLGEKFLFDFCKVKTQLKAVPKNPFQQSLQIFYSQFKDFDSVVAQNDSPTYRQNIYISVKNPEKLQSIKKVATLNVSEYQYGKHNYKILTPIYLITLRKYIKGGIEVTDYLKNIDERDEYNICCGSLKIDKDLCCGLIKRTKSTITPTQMYDALQAEVITPLTWAKFFKAQDSFTNVDILSIQKALKDLATVNKDKVDLLELYVNITKSFKVPFLNPSITNYFAFEGFPRPKAFQQGETSDESINYIYVVQYSSNLRAGKNYIIEKFNKLPCINIKVKPERYTLSIIGEAGWVLKKEKIVSVPRITDGVFNYPKRLQKDVQVFQKNLKQEITIAQTAMLAAFTKGFSLTDSTPPSRLNSISSSITSLFPIMRGVNPSPQG